MRAFCAAIVILTAAPAVASSRVVVMTDPELGAALEVALAARRIEIATSPSPGGTLRLDRAAAAQRAALDADAEAAVWIDLDADGIDVCAVSSDGRYFRRAPLPADRSPRLFAAIATSLLDELLVPPEGPHVDVHVDVNVAPAPQVAVVAPPSAAVPVVVEAPAPPAAPIRWDRTLFEIGPMASPVTIGLEGSIMFPLAPSWRIGVSGSANVTVVDEAVAVFGFAGELRHVGSGWSHFDLGFMGGAATADGDTVGWTGVRFAWNWERQNRNTSFGFAPLLIFTGDTDGVVPGVFASLRVGLPL